jgi:hypothetical protein
MTTSEDKIIALPDSFFMHTGMIEGRQKISIGITSTSSHLTITNNGPRRVINAHITYEDRTKPAEYFCEMSYFTCKRFLVRMKQILIPLQQQFLLSRTVNLGRLKRHRLIFVTSTPDAAAENAIVKVNGGKTYLRSKKNIRSSILHTLVKYPDDIPSDDAKCYFLFSPHRRAMQGIIFRNPLAPQSKRYFFITHKMLREFCKAHNQQLYVILTDLQFKHKEKLLQLLEEKLLPQV